MSGFSAVKEADAASLPAIELPSMSKEASKPRLAERIGVLYRVLFMGPMVTREH
jgi:hypothetical protein